MNLVDELPEGRLRVVSRAGLLAMKRMAARPQDDADVERLRELCELTAYLHRGRLAMGSVARDDPAREG